MTLLGVYLATAEQETALYLGYTGTSPTWESASYTLRLEAGGDTAKLYLPVNPVTAIASIYQDNLLQFGAGSDVASTDYEQQDTTHGPILHLLPSGLTAAWLTRTRAVKVTCTAGYANEAAVPRALADAVYRWASDAWNRRRVRTVDNASQGGTSLTFKALGPPPADVATVLDEYVLWSRLGVA